ncbi:MAG: PilZ domain-containing protein [Rhodospirillales bacterium]|nr:PilZ domain-containing protein [Alphaproteobacteria bacterium]MCB1840593.1 PilZ domain-containing protein [Alphaproteobacteria bacterium]MCB9976341.1 PilZ domain-containing protein [Rhodospirillales bacterium]
MFGKIFSSFKSKDETDDQSRRQFARRNGDHCVSVINGKIYPVENWSMGGFLIAADDRLFGVTDAFDVTMKFKLRNSILDIPHSAMVVRKSHNRVALEFKPMTKAIKSHFQQVVDDVISQGFVDSQLT